MVQHKSVDLQQQSTMSSSNSTKDLISNNGDATLSNVQVAIQDPGDFQMSYLRRYITVGILFLVNLLNYMDRSTIAGVLSKIQDFFKINDTEVAILQVIFIVGFMCTAPLFGYAGDRYNRKWLMIGGITLWSLVTLAGSFVGDPTLFPLFVVLRGIVGIGEASYVTIAPSLISDMFLSGKRSAMLMIFYFAIPVGSGLGYIAASYTAEALKGVGSDSNGWEWAFRVTPGLGMICVLLIALVAQDPPRGMAEDGVNSQSKSTIKEDMLALVKNKTYVLVTFGNSAVTFVAGALALFAPKFMYEAYKVSGDLETPETTVALYTGIVTTAAGFLGVGLGTIVAHFIKKKHTNGDALVCACALIISAPLLFAALVVCQWNMAATWVFVLFGEISLFMNWSLVADILLYTVAATRRSTAQAMQIFVSHLLGDVASPLLIGRISDALRGEHNDVYHTFKALQYSLFITVFICVLGGFCFLIASLYLVKDKATADAANKGISWSDVHRRPLHNLPLDDMVPILGGSDEYLDDDGDVPFIPT